MVLTLTPPCRDAGRTVIFTTHHLDEAEALGDRVAFLQQGRLCCCGPPFCLTEAYGQGLSLTLTKQVGSWSKPASTDSASSLGLDAAGIQNQARFQHKALGGSGQVRERVSPSTKETEYGDHGVCAVGSGAGEAGGRPWGSRWLGMGEAELQAELLVAPDEGLTV